MKANTLPFFGMPKTDYVISSGNEESRTSKNIIRGGRDLELVQKEMTDYFDFEFSKKQTLLLSESQ